MTSEAEKNAIWDALKTVPDWRNEVVADIKVVPKPGVSAPVSSMKTYTVKAGDTLSGIAREYLGDAKEYMRIFEANQRPAERSRQDQAWSGAEDSCDGSTAQLNAR